VTLDRGQRPSVSALRRRLGALVPEFMVPSRFVFLDALPVSGTGKVDRSALPEPDGVRPRLDVAYQPPATPIERRLAALWAELLGVDPVGRLDSFFDLGGTSLMAARLAARLHVELGVEADLRAFLDSPTVAALSEAVLVQLAERLPPEELEPLLRRLRDGQECRPIPPSPE